MMTDHDVECYPPPECVCRSGGSLGILKEVQRLYEERLALIERNGGDNKMQLKVDTLKSWVCDLVSQNSLLIRVVEELESEATTRLLLDRKRHAEIVYELMREMRSLRQRLRYKENDVRGLLEVLRRMRICESVGQKIHFIEVSPSDLFGKDYIRRKHEDGDTPSQDFREKTSQKTDKPRRLYDSREKYEDGDAPRQDFREKTSQKTDKPHRLYDS